VIHRKSWRRGVLWIWFILGGVNLLAAEETVMVKTTSDVEKAWMGQRVRFVVTLYSPGPFTGTPVFQIPELGDTVISKDGSPVVGSESIGGDSWITQRHEFNLYTQKTGTIQVPEFQVSFESKDDFLGDAKPRKGETEPFEFVSARPPGTDELPFVVSSSTLEVEESWSNDDEEELEAGEVVTRSIVRTATDTSAMFLDPFAAGQIDGVRVYVSDPSVEEVSERGVSKVSRTDVIRYQFAKGGHYEFPPITYSWWDPEGEKVRTVTLEGRSFTAKAPPVPPEPTDWKRVAWLAALVALGVAASARWAWPWLMSLYRSWHERYHAPLAVASRSLRTTCRAGDASGAFVALMAWKHAAGIEGDFVDPLAAPAAALSARLYAGESAQDSWEGRELLAAFRQVEADHRRRQRGVNHQQALPPLNPGLSR